MFVRIETGILNFATKVTLYRQGIKVIQSSTVFSSPSIPVIRGNENGNKNVYIWYKRDIDEGQDWRTSIFGFQ